MRCGLRERIFQVRCGKANVSQKILRSIHMEGGEIQTRDRTPHVLPSSPMVTDGVIAGQSGANVRTWGVGLYGILRLYLPNSPSSS